MMTLKESLKAELEKRLGRRLDEQESAIFNEIIEHLKPKMGTDTFLRIYRREIKRRRKANRVFDRGVTKIDQGDFEGALACFDEVMRLVPNHAGAYINRGATKESLGNHKDAVADYDKSISLNPMNAMAYYNRGTLKGKSRDYKGAIADFDKALSLNPKYHEAYCNRALARFLTRDYKDAISDWQKAIRLLPSEKLILAPLITYARKLSR